LPLHASSRMISESNVPQARRFPVEFTERQVSGDDCVPTGLYRTVFFNPNHPKWSPQEVVCVLVC
jgi:hypothetical protein